MKYEKGTVLRGPGVDLDPLDTLFQGGAQPLEAAFEGRETSQPMGEQSIVECVGGTHGLAPHDTVRRAAETARTAEEIQVKQYALRPLVAVVLGLAVTWIWELFLGGIPVAGHVLHPGLLAYVALMAMALPVVWKGTAPAWQWAWFFASAVVLAELPLLAARSSQDPEPGRLLGIGTLIALVFLLPPAFIGGGRVQRGVASPRVAAGVWAVAMLTIGACQGSNRLARVLGIPNEGRSLIVGGLEIHHLNFGVLLLVASVLLLSRFPASLPWWRGLLLGVLGVAVGLIADEWLYYAATEVTDQAYFEPLTWQSALLLSSALLATWFVWARNEARRESSP